jgi:hypothetical protein
MYFGSVRNRKNGNIIISAACDGGTIIAPFEMFKEI